MFYIEIDVLSFIKLVLGTGKLLSELHFPFNFMLSHII